MPLGTGSSKAAKAELTAEGPRDGTEPSSRADPRPRSVSPPSQAGSRLERSPPY